MKNKKTAYYILRILLVAAFFHLLLVLPPYFFVVIKSLPEALMQIAGNSDQNFTPENLDFFNNTISILGLFVFYLFNLPFKIRMRRINHNTPCRQKIVRYTKKLLPYTPHINAVIFLSFTILPTLLLFHKADVFKQTVPGLYDTIVLFGAISFVGDLLVALIIFLWQKNRVQLNYLTHFYTLEELKTRTTKHKNSRVYVNFLFSGLITTALPVITIFFYLTLNASYVKDFVDEREALTDNQAKLLFGNYYELYLGVISEGTELNMSLKNLYEKSKQAHKRDKVEIEKTDKKIREPNAELIDSAVAKAISNNMLFYYNALNSIFMIMGIIGSFIVAGIYVLLISRLNSRLIVVPINDLMQKMRNTAKGKLDQYAIVRSDNELGVLAESFNTMSAKLKQNFEELTELNQNLEQKVIERTAYIELQKEEITTQRDEIEAQRDSIQAAKDEIEAQHEEVVQQRDRIAKQNTQITDSIVYAQTIQQAIIPSEEALNEVLPHHVLFFRPRDIVSGDFYWIGEVSGQLIVVAADSTGHGVPGALMSMLGVSILNEIAALKRFKNAADILEMLRTQLVASMNPKGSAREAKDGMDMSLCIIDKQKQELQFAGALNPLIYFENNKMIEIKATRSPIGVYRKPQSYTNHVVKFSKDTTFYMFSDGYRDQMAPDGSRLKSKGFKKLLQDINQLPFDQQLNQLNTVFDIHKQNAEQTDDCLVLGFRIDG